MGMDLNKEDKKHEMKGKERYLNIKMNRELNQYGKRI